MSIIQRATIIKIENGQLFLSICRPEACGACKAQSACASSGGGKEIVLEDDGRDRKVGDELTLKITHSQGFKAIVLAYLVPVALIVALLVGFQSLDTSEIVAGGVTLALVAVYFIILRIFRNKLETELTIEIE